MNLCLNLVKKMLRLQFLTFIRGIDSINNYHKINLIQTAKKQTSQHIFEEFSKKTLNNDQAVQMQG